MAAPRARRSFAPRGALAGLALTVVAAWPGNSTAVITRDYVSILASPDLRRFSEASLSYFGAETRFKYPELRTTNTAAALRLLCAGGDVEYPDIAFMWRPLTDEERENCLQNLGPGLAEVLIGYEGIAAVRLSGFGGVEEPVMEMSALDLFTAMAATVPPPTNHPDFQGVASGNLTENLYTKWSEIDPDLPDREIHVVAPPPSHPDAGILFGTVLSQGCAQVEGIAVFEQAEPDYYRELCQAFREDGRLEAFNVNRYDLLSRLKVVAGGFGQIETLGDEYLYQAEPLENPPLPIGFMRINDLEQSLGLEPIPIEGALPEPTLVRNGLYPAARPIYLMIKVQNFSLIPGFRDFVNILVSDTALGPEGFLAEAGLVPLSPEAIGQANDAIFEAILMATTEGAGLDQEDVPLQTSPPEQSFTDEGAQGLQEDSVIPYE